MYKKYMAVLLLINMVIIMAAFNVTGLSVNRIMSKPAFQLTLEMALTPLCEVNKNGIMPAVASGQRVISYEVIEKDGTWEVHVSSRTDNAK